MVIYDYLVSRDILLYADDKARLTYAGKKGKDHTIPQAEINALLIREAAAGNVVARLKGGDPFIFGRGGEEAVALAQAGLPFEVVPGVTSAISVPAYAGIPLTHRSFTSTTAFVAGREDPTKEKSNIDWKALASIGTVVFLMGVKNLPAIVDNLTQNGKDPSTPAALIRWGTTPDQETLISTLGDIVSMTVKKGFRPPAVLIVGSVVGLREHLNWFEKKPLFGRNVMITLPKEQAEEFAALVREHGARVIHFPTNKIVPANDWREFDRAIGAIGDYNGIIFTCVNCVSHFFQRLRELGKDIRELKGIRICTVGSATFNAIEARGIRADIVSESFTSKGVLRALWNEEVKECRLLLLRAGVASEVIPRKLAKLGAVVDVVTVCRTVSSGREKSELEELIKKKAVDLVIFSSSSAVTIFMDIMGHDYSLLSQVKIACIDAVTAATAREEGLKIDIMQKSYTIVGLVEGMIDHFGGRSASNDDFVQTDPLDRPFRY